MDEKPTDELKDLLFEYIEQFGFIKQAEAYFIKQYARTCTIQRDDKGSGSA
ncbi:hypothetical protein ROA7450_03351 [Roseovarius albus]|uniref:Uncharacterized protein n=1 Tax=Roseovarius albus TaxID=1247867 RepID=A0A1X6ZWV4_9RHOB|nr:hypothetical protein [Roseovarius albus]SLN63812.1 hypothetical protein ROA7450_03351 [Roseovarius albus]